MPAVVDKRLLARLKMQAQAPAVGLVAAASIGFVLKLAALLRPYRRGGETVGFFPILLLLLLVPPGRMT